jgi:hypothetical protein
MFKVDLWVWAFSFRASLPIRCHPSGFGPSECLFIRTARHSRYVPFDARVDGRRFRRQVLFAGFARYSKNLKMVGAGFEPATPACRTQIAYKNINENNHDCHHLITLIVACARVKLQGQPRAYLPDFLASRAISRQVSKST